MESVSSLQYHGANSNPIDSSIHLRNQTSRAIALSECFLVLLLLLLLHVPVTLAYQWWLWFSGRQARAATMDGRGGSWIELEPTGSSEQAN